MSKPHFQGLPPVGDFYNRFDQIRRRAYQRWVQRGRPPASEVQDWAEAEAEYESCLPPVPADPALLQAIIDNTTAVVHVKDTQGRYLLVNRCFEKLFQVSQCDLLGKTVFDLYPPDIAQTLWENDRLILDSGQPIEFEEQVQVGDDRRTFISLKFPIRNAQGQLFAVCGIATDITERRRIGRHMAAEHAVSRALAEANTLNEAAPRVLQAICQAMGWAVGALWCVDYTGHAMRCVEVWHRPDAPVASFEHATRWLAYPQGAGLPGEIWARKAPVWVADTTDCEQFVRAVVAAEGGCVPPWASPSGPARTSLGSWSFSTPGLIGPPTTCWKCSKRSAARSGSSSSASGPRSACGSGRTSWARPSASSRASSQAAPRACPASSWPPPACRPRKRAATTSTSSRCPARRSAWSSATSAATASARPCSWPSPAPTCAPSP